MTIADQGLNPPSVTSVVSGPLVFEGHRISWSGIIAGVLVATAVTFFLLALGSGFGLSLVSARHANHGTAVTFLSLGAVYFFAAQAFGFAAGGHVTGRLIGPLLENRREEEFLAGAHGLVMWALAVVLSVGVLALAAMSGAHGAMLGTSMPADSRAQSAPAATAYWVDRLFRPAPEATHASLYWRQYAQADTGTASDATPQPNQAPAQSEQQPQSNPQDSEVPSVEGRMSEPSSGSSETSSRRGSESEPAEINVPADTTPGASPQAAGNRDIAADKAEASRILTVAMADGGPISDIDRAELVHLVSADTGLTQDAATTRVQTVETQMRDSETRTAELARKTAAYASLWTALALLFGAIVATAAAVSARLEDDRVSFGFGRD